MFNDRTQKSPITAEDWSLGLAHAPVTMLEYGDFECPYCAMTRSVLESLVADFPSTFRLVFRHFPITTIHPHALMAAEAAEAAGAQRRFWEMHDMIFTHQSHLEYDDLRSYAAAIGLDMSRFDRDMRAHVHKDEVRNDFRLGVLDGVNGTPTVFINRVRYDGPRDRESILAAVTVR